MKHTVSKLFSLAALILTSHLTYASTPALVAGGQDLSISGGAPFLISDTDGTGTNWNPTSVIGLPTNGNFVSANCGDSLCIAAGNTSLIPGAPLLALTTNPTSSVWYVQSISGLPSNPLYTSADCSGTALCTAVGAGVASGPTVPFLIQTTNAGSSWSIPAAGLPSTGFMNSTSCSSAYGVCVAVGQTSTSSTSAPIITVTTNSGTSWGIPSIPGLPTAGELVSTSCGTGFCVAVGQTVKAGSPSPLLVFSSNSGSTWSLPSVTGLPSSGNFNAASCSETSSSNNLCSAVGLNGSGFQPLVATSVSGGTWQVQSVSGAPSMGYFSATSCVGTSASGVCIAAGANLSANLPLLAVSINGGTWNVVSMSGISTAGQFYGAACTQGKSSNFVCVAAGQDFTGTKPPLLVVSTDSGATWAKQTVGSLTNYGSFWSVGGTPYLGMKKTLEKVIQHF